MRTSLEGARRGAPSAELVSEGMSPEELVDRITLWLDDAKAENVVSIDLRGKSSIGDTMVIATGRTDRHVGAIADRVARELKQAGFRRIRVEGLETCDWVLVDAGDVIVHIFRPEVREFYNLERMWSEDRPAEAASH